MKRIRVMLIKPESRRFFQAQWIDPVTGMKRTKSTGETQRRSAERVAARIEDQLNGGKSVHAMAPIKWADFQTRYDNDVLKGLRPSTRVKAKAAFNAVTKFFKPMLLAAVASAHPIEDPDDPDADKTDLISMFQRKLTVSGKRPFTVRGHLVEIRKALRWASRKGLIGEVPHIDLPKTTDAMKGRPITGEEFDRMVAAVSKVVKPGLEDGWKKLLRGLHLSGLRLHEALRLHWTDDTQILMDMTGKTPMFRIQANSDKAGVSRLLPCTPDFEEFVKAVPVNERTGFVFNPSTPPPKGRPGGLHRPTMDHASKVISRIGKKAKVKVSDTKFASAHDLRRAFGVRWAKIVDILTLQELMRHESIETTRSFYLGHMAEATAAKVRTALQQTGNASGNTTSHESKSDVREQVTNQNK